MKTEIDYCRLLNQVCGFWGALAEGDRLVSGTQSSGMGSTYLFVKGLIEVCKRKIDPFIVNGSFFRKVQLELYRYALYQYGK